MARIFNGPDFRPGKEFRNQWLARRPMILRPTATDEQHQSAIRFGYGYRSQQVRVAVRKRHHVHPPFENSVDAARQILEQKTAQVQRGNHPGQRLLDLQPGGK